VWDLNLPPGQYEFDLAPSSGDADLYMKAGGSVASTTNYDCRPYSSGTVAETCTWTLPGPSYGHINVMVRGYVAGTSSFTLRGYYNN
jgi:hypothetical protein